MLKDTILFDFLLLYCNCRRFLEKNRMSFFGLISILFILFLIWTINITIYTWNKFRTWKKSKQKLIRNSVWICMSGDDIYHHHHQQQQQQQPYTSTAELRPFLILSFIRIYQQIFYLVPLSCVRSLLTSFIIVQGPVSQSFCPSVVIHPS